MCIRDSGLAETIQNFVDSMLNGPGQNNNNLTYGGYPGAPMSNSGAPPKPPTPVIGRTESGAGNPLDGIASAFSGLFGGNNSGAANGSNSGGGFAEGIAKLGTMLTKNMQNNNKTAATTVQPQKPVVSQAKPSGPKVKGRIDKRTLFG
jgi:hypothetical protein